LSWWLLAAVIPGALLKVFLELQVGGSPGNVSYAMGAGMGTLLMGTLLGALVARLVFWGNGGKQAMATWLAVPFAMIVSLAPAVLTAADHVRQTAVEQAALLQVEEEVRVALQAMVTAQTEANVAGAVFSQSEMLQDYAKVFKEGASRLGPRQSVVFQALGEAIDAFALTWKTYDDALARLLEAGALEESTLTSVSEIVDRIELNEAFGEANAAVAQHANDMPGHLERKLRDADIDERAMATVNAGFLESFNARMPLMLRVRELDAAIVEVAGAMLNFLKDEWGRWEHDPETQTTYFETDEAVARYDELITQLNTLSAEQDQAIRNALQEMSSVANER
jgi:hypothetical protein